MVLTSFDPSQLLACCLARSWVQTDSALVMPGLAGFHFIYFHIFADRIIGAHLACTTACISKPDWCCSTDPGLDS